MAEPLDAFPQFFPSHRVYVVPSSILQMPRNRIPQNFSRVGALASPLSFQNNEGSLITIDVLDHHLIRVRHVPPTATELKNTFTVTGPTVTTNHSETENGPKSGKGINRANVRHLFPCPEASVKVTNDIVVVQTDLLVITVCTTDGDFGISWSAKTDTNTPAAPFASDLPNRAYQHDVSGGVSHFMSSPPSDIHYGLGERAAPLALTKRRFRLETVDAMGYDSGASDPLYKFDPFTITLNTTTRLAYGLFYDSLSTGVMDLGCEIDALWGPYRYYKADYGVLDYYMIFGGGSIAKVVEGYAGLIGMPALGPKYSLGYLASAMGYAEAENAQEQIAAFPDLCRKYDIPCDLLHLSSGYTGEFIVIRSRLLRLWDLSSLGDLCAARITQKFRS